MFKITEKDSLSENVTRLVIQAELIAKTTKPGQFVIIKLGEKGERIPLTIADSNEKNGTITLIIQRVGTTSHKLCRLNAGDYISDLVGPLGKATEIEKLGTIIAAGGGVGIAPMYPIARALKEAGNKLIAILAARSRDLIILEDEIKSFADETIIMTDDGSYGKKGLVTAAIEEVINREKIDQVFGVGPAVMMKFVTLLTKKHNIPTMVSLNTIMVDGTGMCGACRITVGGKTKFVCVDGPEFNGHEVDFDEMLKRLNAYKKLEEESYSKYLDSLK